MQVARKTTRLLPAVVAALALLIAGSGVAGAGMGGDFIVVLRDQRVDLRGRPGVPQPSVTATVADLRSSLHVIPTLVYESAVRGFAAQLTPTQRARLLRDPRVAAVIPDEAIQLAQDEPVGDPTSEPTAEPSPDSNPTPGPDPTPTAEPTPGPDFQVVPRGVRRIGRPDLNRFPITGADSRVDADIAIVDTGVSDHPDLNVVGGHDCTGSRARTWRDGNGHGTHVAGTAAALDNGLGVVGVAPGARIWSVRVLNKRGVGKASWLLCGVNWIAAQRDGERALIEVANFSLRFKPPSKPADDDNCGYTRVDVVHQAICAVIAAGTVVVAAAGNERRDAANFRPGAYKEVVTVSALSDLDGLPGSLVRTAIGCADSRRSGDDRLAPFSNFGGVVDVMAPGKCIWSTYTKNRYRQMSGTSMATPHVSGTVALYRMVFPGATPEQIRAALTMCGKLDWTTASDRDDVHEPIVNAATLCDP